MDLRGLPTSAARSRNRSTRRASATIAFAFVVILLVSGCGAGAGASMNLTKGLSNAVKAALSKGVETATTTVDDYADDLARAVDQTVIVPPSGLQKAIAQADEAVEAGVTLTDDEARLVNAADKWIVTYRALDRALQLAIDWEVAIPDDAWRLAVANFVREPSAEFRAYVVALEEKLLKNLLCTSARLSLDEAGEAQAELEVAAYEYVGSDSDAVATFIDGAIAAWDRAYEVLDSFGLGDGSVALANSYIEGINDVIESPDVSIAAANIIYFRSCVYRNR